MDASSAAVTAAFPALARVWHPDKLRPEQSSLRDAMTRIFARMTEANAVLGHAESRRQYDQALFAQMDEDQEQEQVSRVLRAAEAFQKAEILMRKRDLSGAEQLAKMAYEGDADQPEYVALYGWIRSRRADCTDDEREQLVSLLKGAVDRQSDNPKIRDYYGCVLKRVGRDTLALREFKFVADRDPSNLEAARELRVHRMRHRHSNPAAAGGGFFDRIFKR
jgi:curved DNA-binding protein CbpA